MRLRAYWPISHVDICETSCAVRTSSTSNVVFVCLRAKRCAIFSVPVVLAITIGQLAHFAILKEPFLNGSSSPVLLRVPSGYIPMETTPSLMS